MKGELISIFIWKVQTHIEIIFEFNQISKIIYKKLLKVS